MSRGHLKYGLICYTHNSCREFDTQLERDAFAITHGQCETELCRTFLQMPVEID